MGTATTIEMTRPVLRPGLHVVRRDDRHLQIGLDEPDRLVLPDQPGLLSALRALPAVPREPALLRVLDTLAEDGWVVDDLRAAPGVPASLALTVDPPLSEAVARACRAAGVTVAGPTGDPTAEPAALRLVATVGEPRRAVSDDLMRADVPHLWLAALPSSVRVGPLVEPGRSACLRCLDAHLGELDPRRATVLHQLGERPAGSESAYDASLGLVGAGLALTAAAGHLGGESQALRSTTLTVARDLTVTRRMWLRHPHCGCAWG